MESTHTRLAEIIRETTETKVKLSLTLDSSTSSRINSGIAFFDHMLEQIARHGRLQLILDADGDLAVDCHHTVEDVGIVLGQALREALGNKAGIERYGCAYVPMDETLARTVLDLSGRVYLDFRAHFTVPLLGGYATEMTREFFRAVAQHAGMTVHIEILHGDNNHHMTEAIFKSFGRALREAVARDETIDTIPSSKGVL